MRAVIDERIFDEVRELVMSTATPTVLQELLTTYLTDARAHLARLEALARRWDLLGLRQTAHTLQGSSGAVGAVRLAAACRELEKAVADGHVEGLGPLLAAARGELEQADLALTARLDALE